MPRKTIPKPWRVADVTFVEIEITHRTDTQLRVEFDCGLRVVIADERQIPLAPPPGSPPSGLAPEEPPPPDRVKRAAFPPLTLDRQERQYYFSDDLLTCLLSRYSQSPRIG